MKSLKELIEDKERAVLSPELEKLRRLLPQLEATLGYKVGALKAEMITEKRIVLVTNNHSIAQDFYLKIAEVQRFVGENFEGERKVQIKIRV